MSSGICLVHILYKLLRFRGVFAFTIAELATSEKSTLKFWHSELVKALTAARVDEKFCTKLMCQYHQSREIVDLLSDALSEYIRSQQPNQLEFDIPVFIPCPVPQLLMFMGKVNEHHKGKLSMNFHHSYLNCIPCDVVLKALAEGR